MPFKFISVPRGSYIHASPSHVSEDTIILQGYTEADRALHRFSCMAHLSHPLAKETEPSQGRLLDTAELHQVIPCQIGTCLTSTASQSSQVHQVESTTQRVRPQESQTCYEGPIQNRSEATLPWMLPLLPEVGIRHPTSSRPPHIRRGVRHLDKARSAGTTAQNRTAMFPQQETSSQRFA